MGYFLSKLKKGGNVDEAEKAFINGAAERGLLGLKGHRSVGGKSTDVFVLK